MSQEVRINGLQMARNLLINGVYWGYNPLTNHLLTSWDIQVHLAPGEIESFSFSLNILFDTPSREVILQVVGIRGKFRTK